MGSTYLRGKTWWIKYYQNGVMVRESSKSKLKTVAKELLKKREGEISLQGFPGVYTDKTTFTQIIELLEQDYVLNNKKSTVRMRQSVVHLEKFFGKRRAVDITSASVSRYILARKEANATNGTINRELSALKRAFSLAKSCSPPLVREIPTIHALKEDNVRTGFFEHEEFTKLQKEIPDYLTDILLFAYKTGCRRSEILTLKWADVDLSHGAHGSVRLSPGTTKNGDGRVLFLDAELKARFTRLKKDRTSLLPWIFLNPKKTDRVKSFSKAWHSACKKAKIDDKIFHDLRRTAVRNMVRAGIPEAVAMKISGHKTRSVFDRYNIVSEKDLQAAAAAQQQYLASLPIGTDLGTVAEIQKQGANRATG